MSDYRYFLEPIGPDANEALAQLLNELGESATSLERRKVAVKGKVVEAMYEVPRHAILTIAGHSIHKRYFRAYAQTDQGETRPYALYKEIGKKVSRTKAVKQMRRELEAHSRSKQR